METDATVLEGVNFSVGKGQLVVCMGMVGCGKTTLLHAIMGETSKQSGECTVRGSIAYVEQEPFIYSATIKDNVTFGRKFDEERF